MKEKHPNLREAASNERFGPRRDRLLGRLSSGPPRGGEQLPVCTRPGPGRNRNKQLVEELLRKIGAAIDGPNPWDIHVRDERFYDRVVRDGDIGLGESYVEDWWDCERLDELACRAASGDLLAQTGTGWTCVLADLKHRLFNLQTRRRAPRVARAHYDLSNEFFEQMLGPSMAYSCGYWREAANLDEAQDAKHELICRKLQLRRHDRVLDVGCGWGAFARYAAWKYGCQVTGITISERQCAYAQRFCAGLPVEVVLLDYRDPALAARGPFDKIVSVGMFEHVGEKNYRHYMTTLHNLLRDDGLFLLHSIGTRGARGTGYWVEAHVFPGSELPDAFDIVRSSDGLFVTEDWHNFGAYYDKTLTAWQQNIDGHRTAREFLEARGIYRRWRYYLLACAGVFRSRRRTQLWQLVLTKNGVPGGYKSVR